jgi:hypothetical protein
MVLIHVATKVVFGIFIIAESTHTHTHTHTHTIPFLQVTV